MTRNLEAAITNLEAAITIGELGEFGLIAAVTAAMAAVAGQAGAAVGGELLLGPGDDAAVLRTPDGRAVATTDMLIEGRHFRTDWSSASDIGHKAAARNLADIAAMGAVPTAMLVGFAGPGRLAVEWVTDLAAGIAAECAAVGAAVAGGDTSSSEQVLIAITAFGDLVGRDPVTRAGARPGDAVAVAGTLGSAAAGVDLLMAGAARDSAGLADPVSDAAGGEVSGGGGVVEGRVGDVAGGRVSGVGGRVGDVAGGRVSGVGGRVGDLVGSLLGGLVSAHRRPRPPYSAGPAAAALGATSLIDVSDGLIADLGHVAVASGVRIELASRLIAAEPIARVDALRQAAKVLGRPDWVDWVLTGGDDHALVATFPADVVLPDAWTAIGTVAKGHGVAVDGRIWSGIGGWEHFRQ